MIDLQIILQNTTIDLARVRTICIQLFAQRRLQPWPTLIRVRNGWEQLYQAQKQKLPILDTVQEAVSWANELILKIDSQPHDNSE